MEYDFQTFIDKSRKICKTRTDFLDKISDEKELILKTNDSQNYKQRQLYLKRLDNAKFCIETGAFKERDLYNIDLASLIDDLK